MTTVRVHEGDQSMEMPIDRFLDAYEHLTEVRERAIDIRRSVAEGIGYAIYAGPNAGWLQVSPVRRMVCARCGSTRVTVDAVARWDLQQQEWVIADVLDHTGDCADCDADTRVVEDTVTGRTA